MPRTRVEEVMRTPAEAVRAESGVQEAAAKMRDAGVGVLVVEEADGRVVGVVTDRDLTVRATAEGADPRTTPVRQVASIPVVACRPEQSLEFAEQLMKEHLVRRIVVTDGQGRAVGLVSLDDLARREGEERETGELLERVVQPEAEA